MWPAWVPECVRRAAAHAKAVKTLSWDERYTSVWLQSLTGIPIASAPTAVATLVGSLALARLRPGAGDRPQLLRGERFGTPGEILLQHAPRRRALEHQLMNAIAEGRD